MACCAGLLEQALGSAKLALVAVDPIKLRQLGVDPGEVPPRAALVCEPRRVCQ